MPAPVVPRPTRQKEAEVDDRAREYRSDGTEGGATEEMLRDLLAKSGITTMPVYILKKVPRLGRDKWIALFRSSVKTRW